MKKRALFSILAVILVLAISYLIFDFNSNIKKIDIQVNTQVTLNDFLSQSGDMEFMPIRCKMPEWSNDFADWEKHLEHHSDTKGCSVYYWGVDEHGN